MSDAVAGRQPRRIAIVGGGISGLAAAYQLTCEGKGWTLFEASGRLGGIVETVHRDGFVIECGPDSWVTEKPWARELATELGLGDDIIASNDQWRRTYVLQGTERAADLVPIPDGMRMMVPTRWGPLLESPLFSWQARLAYLREPKRAAELKEAAPAQDESVAAFVRRHFGEEVVSGIAGPLLAAVFGGDIHQLSVRAVMPAFVAMESAEGSLIQALQRRAQQASPAAVFTTLAGGLGTLIDRLVARLRPGSVRMHQPVLQIEADRDGWRVATAEGEERFDDVVLATPLPITLELLRPIDPNIDRLLPREATSAIAVALAFDAAQASRLRVPRGFGFVVPPSVTATAEHRLLACTFVHQKFPGRAPEGAVLLRAFFGGHSGEALLGERDDELIERARRQLSRVLGPLPPAAETIVRRWPHSLPQYAVGHLDRMAELSSAMRALPGLHLLGSSYHGVGLPDLIRDGRALARSLAGAA
jgi:oxygen-dependent protoporphyrinogen oxidase